MEVIEKLCDCITDEIKDIEKYSKLAIELKEKYPQIADILYQISTQEDKHQEMLHNAVEQIISEHRKEGSAVPDSMELLYNYIHKRDICDYEKAIRFQQMYKK